MDAYVAPGIELIYERAPGEFRGQWEALQKHLTIAHPRPAVGDRASSHLTLTVDGRRPQSAVWDDEAAAMWTGAGAPVEPGILHDNPAGRLRSMDELGIDVQLLSPGVTIAATRWLPSNIGAGVLGAYNNYALAYCAEDPSRLKTVVQLHGGEPEWSAAELRELASERAVAAATLWLPTKVSPDDRRFAPIWHVLEETGVPLLHRPTACSPVWTPRRLMAFLAHTRILDRYPSIRIAFGETGIRWVGDWLDQVEQAVAASGGGEVDVHAYARDGRLFATVDAGDDIAAVERAAEALGDGALLWQSHFPYRKTERLDADAGGLGRYAHNAWAFLEGPSRLEVAAYR